MGGDIRRGGGEAKALVFGLCSDRGAKKETWHGLI